ncbi:MAG: hypothetical protein US49_C0001G0096 [candidate division TM6 bacterium GW2011_GWF2_37_49]|nr:MAG: hypothetical protein US49_C0001G0096 [candidate division TM6 bacterium GW2011_GWF2_37_49]
MGLETFKKLFNSANWYYVLSELYYFSFRLKKFMKNLTKYLLVLIVAFLITGSTSAAAMEPVSPETQEFQRLAEKVLATDKPSMNERIMIGVVREVVKIGGCALLFKLASSVAAWENKDVLDVGVGLFKNVFGFSGEDATQIATRKNLTKNAQGALVLVVAIIFALICDASIATNDHSLKAIQNLKKYAKTLTPEQKFEAAKLFKIKYSVSLNNKVAQEGDGFGTKFLSLGPIFFDFILPLMPLFIYVGSCIYDAKSKPLGQQRDAFESKLKAIGADLKAGGGVWNNDPTKNYVCLAACIGLFVLNSLPSAINLFSSTDRQKRNLLKSLQQELN